MPLPPYGRGASGCECCQTYCRPSIAACSVTIGFHELLNHEPAQPRCTAQNFSLNHRQGLTRVLALAKWASSASQRFYFFSAGTSDSVPPDQQKPQTPPKQAPRRGAASKKHRRAKMNGATEPSHHVSQVRM